MAGTIFREGDHVDYVGDGLDGIPAAQGKIVEVAPPQAAHVLWTTGARIHQIDLVNIYDLEHSASLSAMATTKVAAPVLVRQVFKREGSTGVLKYLAAIHQLDSWREIAEDLRQMAVARLMIDSSLDLASETLTPDQFDDLVHTAADVLLHDSFSEDDVA